MKINETCNDSHLVDIILSVEDIKRIQNGEVVYVVTYWVNVHNNMSMASVQVPGANYSSVLYRTFDLEINPYFNWEERIDT